MIGSSFNHIHACDIFDSVSLQTSRWQAKMFGLRRFLELKLSLRHEDYQDFEEGNLRFTKMNGEYQNLFDSRILKSEKPRRERVLNSGFIEVIVPTAILEL